MNNKLPKIRVSWIYDHDGEKVVRVKLYDDLHDAIERIAENYHQYSHEGYMTDFEVSDNDKVNASLARLQKSEDGFISEGIKQFLECERGYLPVRVKTLMIGEPENHYYSKYDWSDMDAREALKSDCPFSKAVAIDLLSGKVVSKGLSR